MVKTLRQKLMYIPCAEFATIWLVGVKKNNVHGRCRRRNIEPNIYEPVYRTESFTTVKCLSLLIKYKKDSGQYTGLN